MRSQEAVLYLRLWPVSLLFVAGYALAGLYPGAGLGPIETLRRQSWVTSVAFLLLTTTSFALKLPHVYSRVTFGIAFGLALTLVPFGRSLALSALTRTGFWPEPVALVTDDPVRAEHLVKALRERPQLGYVAAALVWMQAPPHGAKVEGLPAAGGLESVPGLAAQGIVAGLVATREEVGPETLDELQRFFHRVLIIRELDDLPVEGIRIRNLGGLLGIELTSNLLDPRNRIAKRLLDIALASVALAAASPLMALAVVAVKLRSVGPALFTQLREGLDGRRIRVPKIRTMVPDAEAELERRMSEDPALRDEWESNMKLRDDFRLVPRVGRFLRRFSLDELPQLWSVLRGDMSLVGPRPFPDYHLARFSPHFRALRQRVRPGITGLWQVTVRSAGTIERQESLDTFYIRNWSIWLDLYILARTVGAVVSGRGAY
jgi:Undecaprenyl-phosphate galactose phosphotransferase WbaP